MYENRVHYGFSALFYGLLCWRPRRERHRLYAWMERKGVLAAPPKGGISLKHIRLCSGVRYLRWRDIAPEGGGSLEALWRYMNCHYITQWISLCIRDSLDICWILFTFIYGVSNHESCGTLFDQWVFVKCMWKCGTLERSTNYYISFCFFIYWHTCCTEIILYIFYLDGSTTS